MMLPGACLAALIFDRIVWETGMIWAAWLVVLADSAYTILRAWRSGRLRLGGAIRDRQEQPGAYWAQLMLLFLFFLTGVWITVAHLLRR